MAITSWQFFPHSKNATCTHTNINKIFKPTSIEANPAIKELKRQENSKGERATFKKQGNIKEWPYHSFLQQMVSMN